MNGEHDKLINFVMGVIVGVLTISFIYWFTGCASTSRVKILEARVDALTSAHIGLETRTTRILDHMGENANSYFELYNQFVSTASYALEIMDYRLNALEKKNKRSVIQK